MWPCVAYGQRHQTLTDISVTGVVGSAELTEARLAIHLLIGVLAPELNDLLRPRSLRKHPRLRLPLGFIWIELEWELPQSETGHLLAPPRDDELAMARHRLHSLDLDGLLLIGVRMLVDVGKHRVGRQGLSLKAGESSVVGGHGEGDGQGYSVGWGGRSVGRR